MSVVVPVFNEAGILRLAVARLFAALGERWSRFEVVLVENGSDDDTFAIGRDLQKTYSQLRLLHVAEPNYGRALRTGICCARGEVVVCDEIDLLDVGFYDRALVLLERGIHMVVGSKRLAGSDDRRPWRRRAGTVLLNALLRVLLGFSGTDTHGVKAFWRQPLLGVVSRCEVERNVFASELVLRAIAGGLQVREIPVALREVRPPAVRLARRVPRALYDVLRLTYALRRSG